MEFQIRAILILSIMACICSAQFPNPEYGNPLNNRFDQTFSSRSRGLFSQSQIGLPRSKSFDSGRFTSNNLGQFNHKQSNPNDFDFESQSHPRFPSEYPLDPEEPLTPAQGQVHKFISVHIAPPEEPSSLRQGNRPQSKPQKPDKHYQIVFIKAPSTTKSDLEEIELPPAPETKTLVYVLLKKPSASDILKIRGQSNPSKPTPPEVFFIRYKGKNQTEKENGEGFNSNKKAKNNNSGEFDSLSSGHDDFENVNEDDEEYGSLGGGGGGNHFK